MLVRSDLPTGLQMAQAIHAAVELSLAHPDRMTKTPTVVVLSVPNEDALLDWADQFTEHHGVAGRIESPWKMFQEPDLASDARPGGEFTALATFHTGEPFSTLPLAGKELAMSG